VQCDVWLSRETRLRRRLRAREVKLVCGRLQIYIVITPAGSK
jgi:hypothetical protein